MAVTTTSGTTGIFNGYSILVFDGSSTLSTAHNTDYAYSTSGDFTIECWVKTSTTTANMAIVSKAASTFASKDFLIRSKGSTGVEVWIYDINSSAAALSSSTNIADGNWHHIALQRTSTGTHLLVDGSVSQTITTSWDATNTNAFLWGDEPVNDVKFTGNMADIRVSGRVQHTLDPVAGTGSVGTTVAAAGGGGGGAAANAGAAGGGTTGGNGAGPGGTTGGSQTAVGNDGPGVTIAASGHVGGGSTGQASVAPASFGGGGPGTSDNAYWTSGGGGGGYYGGGGGGTGSGEGGQPNQAGGAGGSGYVGSMANTTLTSGTGTGSGSNSGGSGSPNYTAGIGKAVESGLQAGHGEMFFTWTPTGGSETTNRFTYSGANQTWTVPADTTTVTVELWGAAGGAGAAYNNGGAGGYAKGDLTVTAGASLTLVIGEGGIGSGNHASSGGGGTWIEQPPASATYTTPTVPFGYGTEVAAVPAYTPKFGNASALFDGDGDILTVASDAKFDLGAGDYTVEAWIKPDVLSITAESTVTYNIHTFTSSGTFTVSGSAISDIEYLVIGGGGGGGAYHGGGGGAGGYRTNFGGTKISQAVGDVTITIGAKGTGQTYGGAINTKGGDTTSAFSSGSIVSAGGGAGSAYANPNAAALTDGGSGGGQAGYAGTWSGSGNTPATTPAQGYDGGARANETTYNNSGGGGGSSEAGGVSTDNTGTPANSGGKGGDGTSNSITGTAVVYAGGGGGGNAFDGGWGPGGAGGTGGGGVGGGQSTDGADATGYGSGGGGGSARSPATGMIGGDGSAGIVIIRYPSSGNSATGGTVTTISSTSSVTTTRTANPVITIGDKLQVTSLSDGKGSVVVDGTAVISGITVLSDSTWRHVAVSRNSGSTRLFINGTQEGITYAGTEDIGQGEVRIGHNLAGADNQYFKGSMDEIRVTKGYSRYNANFTPLTREFGNTTPVATGDPYYDSVVLSLHMNGVDASTTFTDSSSTGHTVTAVGNAQIDTGSGTDNPKFGTARGLFDGTGDKLTVPSNTEFEMGTGDYTLEGWIKTETTGSAPSIVAGGGGLLDFGGTSGNYPLLHVDTTGHVDTTATSTLDVDATEFGGTLTTVGSYNVHTFLTSGTFKPQIALTIDMLVVAGGGGGGGFAGGGGGAGGFRTKTSHALAASATTGHTVVIGAGGAGGAGSESAGAGTSGGDSSIDGFVSTGGGGGGGYAYNNTDPGKSGGSGGGTGKDWRGGQTQAGGTGNTPSTSPSQGNNGGQGTQYPSGGAGGGGASAVGANSGASDQGGAGGAGTSNDYRTGSGVTYAGGGGGGCNSTIQSRGGAGGTGGGGPGGYQGMATDYNDAPANLGGGGGAGAYPGTSTEIIGGDGGSGIIVIRYLTSAVTGQTYQASVTTPGSAANASSVVKYDIAGTNLITSTTNLDDDAWHHVAVSRQSTSTRMYINGVQEGSTAVDSPSATSLAQNGITIGEKPGSTTTVAGTGLLANATLPTDLLAYYRMEDDWTDSKGSNNATATNATFTTGKLASSKAGSFDGSGDYATTGNMTIGTAFSFSFWMNGTSWPSNACALASTHYHTSGYDGNFMFRISGTTSITWASYDGTGSETSMNFTVPTLSTSTWYHVVITCDGTTLKVYLNGTVNGSTLSHTKDLSDLANGGLLIGSDVGGPNADFNGAIDEVGVWTKELSSTEVTALYNSGDGLAYGTASSSTTVAAKGFNGKLDDWRITKGVARYTANFGLPVAQNFDITAAAGVPIGDSLYYSTGRVGIGNTNPGYTLDVTGSLNLTGNIYESGVQKSLGTTAVSLYADLPTATTDNRGHFYLVTSTNKMYWSNGTTWVAVGSAIPSWTTYVATAGQTYTTDMGTLDYNDGETPAGNVTHTAGATGAAGSGTPMATTTFLATDPASDVITYGIESVEVTAVGADDTTNSVGTISPKPTWISVASDGKLSITPDHTYKSDTLNIVGTASDGVNTLTKNFNFILSGDGPTDEYWDNVCLVINGDETVASSQFTAKSGITTAGHTATLSSAVAQTTGSGGKFGEGYVWSHAGYGHQISLPYTALESIGSGAFTMECWQFWPSTTGQQYNMLFNAGYWTPGWFIQHNGPMADQYYKHYINTTAGAMNEQETSSASTNAWHHYAWVGDGSSNFRFYRNGALTLSYTKSYDLSDHTSNLEFGDDSYTGFKMDEIRVTKGVERYKGTNTTEWSNYLNDGTTSWTAQTETWPTK